MREFKIKEVMLKNVNDTKVICPMQSGESEDVCCTINCAWFNKSRDSSCDAINVFCKDYFMGILKAKDSND